MSKSHSLLTPTSGLIISSELKHSSLGCIKANANEGLLWDICVAVDFKLSKYFNSFIIISSELAGHEKGQSENKGPWQDSERSLFYTCT